MARSTPHVDESVLIGREDAASNIVVGSPAWYTWLEDANTFSFTSAVGSFTARKERHGQTGWYWKAYRKHKGRLHRAYLGKSADLSIDRLNVIAYELAGRAARTPLSDSGSEVGRGLGASGVDLARLSDTLLPMGTLTFLFTDIEGSTQLWEQHSQTMPHALARHDSMLRQAIAAHAGVVFKAVGDSMYAVFVQPADALAAALAAQQMLHAADWNDVGRLRVRMALHTGTAEPRDGDYFGGPLNRLSRILALGHGGQILLSQATHDLVVDDVPPQTSLRALGVYQLKDLTRREPIFQLVSPDLPADFPSLRAITSSPTLTLTSPLLTTKLHAPPAGPQLLVRPRLLAHMDASLSAKLTLLSAPPGFGKTTLVSAWLQSIERRAQRVEQDDGASVLRSPFSALRSAWVSLDAADSDPLKFWSYVIAALDMLHPDIGASALSLLQSPQPPIEAVLTPLLNALSTLMTDTVLVLDDYHLIDSPAIHSAVTFLLDHLPARLHLIITTRADPPLPLTRLRARGQLTELRATDLRFTPEETAAFLTELMGLPLSADDVTALEAHTEGWIAGLQLAAIAVRDRVDGASFTAAFTGSHRFVVDYLAEEVVDRLPAHIQTFVLQTSILDRLCAPLCDAVLLGDEPGADSGGQAYSQLVLEELERANLFLTPLDDKRHWYRFHQLFAEVLKQRLTSGASGEMVATLHKRASRWYEAQHLVPEAIQHTLAAGAFDNAARLIEQVQWAMLGQSTASYTLVAWLTALPEAIVQARPRLCLGQALLAKQSTLAVLEGWVRQAEAALERTTPAAVDPTIGGELAAFQATLAMYRGDLEEAIELTQQALGTLPTDNSLLRSTAMMIESQALLAKGDLVGAEAAFGRIASTANITTISSAISAACNRAYLQRAQGRLQAASTTCRAMVDRAIRLGVDTIPELGFVAAVQADLARERNDLHTAQKFATDALALNRLWADPMLRQLILLVQARIQQAQGDLASASLTLDEARQIEHVASALFSGILAAFSAQLTLMRGDLTPVNAFGGGSADAATAVAHVSPLFMVYVAEHSRIAPIQALIAAARAGSDPRLLQQALELIAQEQAPVESAGLGWLQTKLYVLRALAAHGLGERKHAMAALLQALVLAAPEGVMRVFLDEGAPMAALLELAAERQAPSEPIYEYVNELLAAFPERQEVRSISRGAAAGTSRVRLQAQELVEPLSARELEILRLIAAGHSNQAIADTLIIAVSTVKRHINNIYGKLDVQSRTQALVRARELNLL